MASSFPVKSCSKVLPPTSASTTFQLARCTSCQSPIVARKGLHTYRKLSRSSLWEKKKSCRWFRVLAVYDSVFVFVFSTCIVLFVRFRVVIFLLWSPTLSHMSKKGSEQIMIKVIISCSSSRTNTSSSST